MKDYKNVPEKREFVTSYEEGLHEIRAFMVILQRDSPEYFWFLELVTMLEIFLIVFKAQQHDIESCRREVNYWRKNAGDTSGS